jgi:N-acetylmuramoyl-L-alanine amidase
MIQVDVPLIEIQRALKAKGYYTGPVDGVWNRETWAAIVEFKRAHGLVPDGVVTTATWALLRQ